MATAPARPERAETPMPTTKVPFLDRVRIGGYGSLRYEVTDNPADQNTTFDAPPLRARPPTPTSRRG